MTQLSFGTVAPTSRRAVAYIIDALIAAGIGILLTIILVIVAVTAGPDGMLAVLVVGGLVAWLLLVGWFIIYTVMQSGNGSIGMRAQGLRLVREIDGAPLGFWMTLLRSIIFGLAASIVVGYFTPLFDGSGRFQGWHDRVARSLMLDARAGGTAAAPPTEAMPVPPRPPLPNSASNAVPPVPGLAAPAPAVQDWSAPPVSPDAAPAPVEQPPAASEPQPETVPAAPVLTSRAPSPHDDSLIAFVPGITQDAPPPAAPAEPEPQEEPPAPEASAPTPEPVLPPISTPADDADIEDTRISIPGHRLVFTWDDGTRVTVSRRTLFGRNPAAEDGAVVVPVRDETLSLSKTHFEAAAEASGGWIVDRNSTNGTVVVRDGQRIACTPGEQVRLRLGDAIEIGDRIVTVGGYV